MSDPASYRTKEELEKYRLEDPIIRLRAQLTREGKLTNEQFDQLDKRAKDQVMASVRFAEESPEPPVDKLYDYVFSECERDRTKGNPPAAEIERASTKAKQTGNRSRRPANRAASTNGEQA
jgi:TPP-dependent pyruvate/acetoin dehydrogenase alpha subunit